MNAESGKGRRVRNTTATSRKEREGGRRGGGGGWTGPGYSENRIVEEGGAKISRMDRRTGTLKRTGKPKLGKSAPKRTGRETWKGTQPEVG